MVDLLSPRKHQITSMSWVGGEVAERAQPFLFLYKQNEEGDGTY